MKYTLTRCVVDEPESLYYGKAVDSISVIHDYGADDCIYDIYQDTFTNWYLCCNSHPLELYARYFCDDRVLSSKHREWCINQYIKTGIMHLRNDEQIAILEHGRFRVEDIRQDT